LKHLKFQYGDLQQKHKMLLIDNKGEKKRRAENESMLLHLHETQHKKAEIMFELKQTNQQLEYQ